MMENLIHKFFEGCITQQEELELFNWLNADEENVRLFSQLRRKYDLQLIANDFENESVDVDAEYNKFKQVLESDGLILQNKERRRLVKQTIRYITTSVAAAALLFFAVEFFRPFIFKTPDKYQEVTVVKGGLTAVRLPDSTLIWLNSQTSFRYADNFSGNGSREVWLDGEAYFDVKSDPENEFIVHTGNIDVKVYGTTFNVMAYPDDSTLEVTLVSGSVGIADAQNGKNLATLVPGNLARYDKQEHKLVLSKVDADLHTCWKDGELRFKNEYFENIALKLERLYGLNIVFLDEEVKRIQFTGTFLTTDPYERIFKVIELYSGVKINIEDQNVYIKNKGGIHR